jgi:hypothetical protein
LLELKLIHPIFDDHAQPVRLPVREGDGEAEGEGDCAFTEIATRAADIAAIEQMSNFILIDIVP